MKHLKKLLLCSITLLGLVNYSCQEDVNLSDYSTIEKIESIDYLKKGEKLENPYSVENMKLAFEKLKNDTKVSKTISNKILEDEFKIETSHYYVKFIPTNKEEEALLKQDTALILFDYPLDYTFPEGVLENRPVNPSDSIPDYYASVRKSKVLPKGVPTEILSELYIPEEDPYFDDIDVEATIQSKGLGTSKKDGKAYLLHNLVSQAYQITGNEEQLIEQAPKGSQQWWIFGSKWYPSGKIMVWDDVLNKEIPIQGVKIILRQWFVVRSTYTRADGTFDASSVKGSAQYIIKWETDEYSIRNGTIWQAYNYGPYGKDAWNHTIKGNDGEYRAHIHEAAWDYYYGHRFGLTSPKRLSLEGQMSIAAHETAGTSSHVDIRASLTDGFLPEIFIKAYGKTSDIVYGTTIHELAHSAHQQLDRVDYNKLVWKAYINPETWGHTPNFLTVEARSARRLMETWAKTVELKFVYERYTNKFKVADYDKYKLRIYYFGDEFLYEYGYGYYDDSRNLKTNTGNDYRLIYTSAGIDMMDNENQKQDVFSVVGSYSSLPNFYTQDRVNGYTINQLEAALVNATSWIEWKEIIKTKYPSNPTKIYLDELFANWAQ